MPDCATKENKMTEDSADMTLNRRLHLLTLGLLLILTGGMWLIPDSISSWGTWLVGVGLILVGVNFIRYLNHTTIGKFTSMLGVMLLCLGVAYLIGARPPLIPVIIVTLGASVIVSAFASGRSRK